MMGFHMNFLGRDQRESLAQVKSHLVAENTSGSGSGAVSTVNSFLQHLIQQVEIYLHNSVEIVGGFSFIFAGKNSGLKLVKYSVGIHSPYARPDKERT